MSFLNISDPNKRDLIVKVFLELKKNIRDDFLSENRGTTNTNRSFKVF